MNENQYHHGDLKKELIVQGIKLMNDVGLEKFSLRKVATMCGVSHAAPYKHFENKQTLIQAMNVYINDSFVNTMKQVVESYVDDPLTQIIELGKTYVSFMVENPDYFHYLFIGNFRFEIQISESSVCECENSYDIFRESAVAALMYLNRPKEEFTEDIIAMWAMVHGLTTMLVTQTIKKEDGYLNLVDSILRTKLSFFNVI
ncbi:MAG: transcriptional regulator, TetR family [Clostridiales bacterium]|jgi:AcrR family transcriptional regulator|nr:transcriptional regulator, TetR family [Clostridiales bacterium]